MSDNEAYAAIVDQQSMLLDDLPDGFRLERTRAAGVSADCDPGLELWLIDARYRPERVIGTAHRAFIGQHMIAWSESPSAGCYQDVESAAAHCVMVRFAVLDAECFSSSTKAKVQ